MQGHQQARQQRRQRQFDNHHPVQRRGGQHDDGSEHGLYQPQAGDAEPTQSRQAGAHGSASKLRKAKALTIMPATNKGTPKPL